MLISLISLVIYVDEEIKEIPKNEIKTFVIISELALPTPKGKVKTTIFFTHCHNLIDFK